MFKKHWKKILLLIILFVVVLAFIPFGKIKITGNAWLLMQGRYANEMAVLADDFGNVMSIYAMGEMSNEDFAKEVLMARDKLYTLRAIRSKKENGYEIVVGSHSWASKKGMEEFNTAYNLFKEMLDAFYKRGSNVTPSSVTYDYLAYKEKIEDALAGYIVAYNWVFASEHPGWTGLVPLTEEETVNEN